MGLRYFAFLLGLGVIAFADAAEDLRSPENVAAGQEIFAKACSGCHGKTGEGGRGPNLNDGVLIRRSTDQRLFGAIKNGVPGSDMPGFPLGEQKVWQVVAYLRSLSSPAMAAVLPGDPKIGRDLFLHKGQCSKCHMIRGQGGFLGPDLTNIGAIRTVKQLRESVLDPNARIAEGFQGITVNVAAGKPIHGILKNSNNYSLQVLDANGGLLLLLSHDVTGTDIATKSLMPETVKAWPMEELNHLLAFLGQQSSRSQRNQ